MSENPSLKTTFNQAAQVYDAIRPGYPALLFDDVLAFSEMPPSGRLLEVGCGTGQATLPFARLGHSIDCLDIGADLLAIAAHNLQNYPNVHFENTSFEAWPARAGAYDLVYAATAFHWVPRETGYPKAALALKPGGTLAIFANNNPRPYQGFAVEVQSVYKQFMPRLKDQRPTTAQEIEAHTHFMQATGLFSRVEVRTYPWTKTYSTAEYIQLLNTYSDHIALEAGKRECLYQGIAGLIDRNYGGKVEKPYLTVLYLGKKPAAQIS